MVTPIQYLSLEEYTAVAQETYPDLAVYINRANWDIYRIITIEQEDFDNLDGKKQKMIKMAVADQTTYLIHEGLEASVTGNSVDSLKIGNYSESTQAGSNPTTNQLIAPTVMEWLTNAGLINRFGTMRRRPWYGNVPTY